MFIAEIGLNHRGSYELAEKYVRDLVRTDVDAITFQIREPGFYVNEHKNSELTYSQYESLKSIVNQSKKCFGFAISDPRLSLYPEPDFIKILSKDLDNLEFIDQVTKVIKNKPIFLSTGMSSFESIKKTLQLISKNRTMNGVKIIHTRLSNSINDVNLKAILSMKKHFGDIVAFGNHCSNINVLYAACSYEPTDYYFYVKHKIDENYKPWQENMNHPDDHHAVDLGLVQQVCSNLVDLKHSLGTGEKNNSANIIEGQR